ncbi:MAG TPA: hypothetical protein VFP84_04730 [Kofleriaceae bacterium]|nr:hypothetical protein [Kofleriaceae bacterium]
MDLRFADHPSFQRAAAAMAGGALLFGVALHPVTAWAPVAGGLLGVALGAAIAGVRRVRGVRGVLGVVVGALAVAAAAWCALRIGQARQTALWPAIARTAAAALAMGVVGSLALLPRHVQLVRDPVRRAIQALPAGLDAELRELCVRAVKLWAAARARTGDDLGRDLVRDAVVQTLEVARKSAEVKLAGPGEGELARRATELDARIAAASDPEARAQYAAARAAVADQARYHGHLRQGRDRLVARMHHHVAALEKYELAAAGLGAARATSTGAQLAELSHAVTVSGDALAEVELG